MKKDDLYSLHKLLIAGIRDVYCAEKDIAFALPKMIGDATSLILKQAFQEHLEVTNTQVNRLKKIFKWMESKPKGSKCVIIQTILKEGKSLIDFAGKGTAARDMGLILIAQKIEHYEIAAYGTLTKLASALFLDKVAKNLMRTLDEELEAGLMYADIALNDVDYPASHPN